MANEIKNIIAREILDSRGTPTLEVKVILKNKVFAKAAVPSGASTGEHEALELRDNNPRRYHGKGVLKAINNVNKKIAPILKNMPVTNQKKIDKLLIKLDGTQNKSRLGANAILGVSLACARAGAMVRKKELFEYIRSTYKIPIKKFRLPIPMMNIINGGRHADNNIDVQEYMIVPYGIKSFREQVRAGSEIFITLKKILQKNKLNTAVGDEGGYAPKLKNNEEPLKYIVKSIKDTFYNEKKQVAIAMDVAASEFYNKDKDYYLLDSGKKKISAKDLDKIYTQWSKEYPIISIEDGLDENDWENWQKHTKLLGRKMMIVGDDLFVTNKYRLEKGIDNKVGNSILIKLNQIGTLSETIETIMLAKKNNYKVIISHRSGETADVFIADLAVAVDSEYIKTGSLSRSERLEKYNRLMEIDLLIKKKY